MTPEEGQVRAERAVCLLVLALIALVFVAAGVTNSTDPASKSYTLEEALTYCEGLSADEALECRDAAMEVVWGE